MNGGALLVLILVSVVTTQRVLNSAGQVVRQQVPIQRQIRPPPVQIQQNRNNFILPSATSSGPVRRVLATRQISHHHRQRILRPTTTSESTTMTTTMSTTTTSTTTEGVKHLKKVDDIEAAILQAVIESSSPLPLVPSSSHRPRLHRIRPFRRPRPSAPPRVDSIEEAVLRAVLESKTSKEKLEDVVTTTEAIQTSSLFPAFASRRHTLRRRIHTTTPATTTSESTTTSSTTEFTTTTETTTTEEPTTTTSTTTLPTTTTSEDTTTTTTTTTTSEEPTTTTTVTEDDSFEDIDAKIEPEEPFLHQIEQNVIAALSSPTPPAPLPTSPEPIQPSGPPGLMPPSDAIVDELNESLDFHQVAERLHLLRRLLQ